TDPSVVHSLRVEPAGTWSQNSRTKLSASDLRTGSPEGVTPESQQPIAYIGVGQSFARTFLIVVWDHNPGLDGIDSAGDWADIPADDVIEDIAAIEQTLHNANHAVIVGTH